MGMCPITSRLLEARGKCKALCFSPTPQTEVAQFILQPHLAARGRLDFTSSLQVSCLSNKTFSLTSDMWAEFLKVILHSIARIMAGLTGSCREA